MKKVILIIFAIFCTAVTWAQDEVTKPVVRVEGYTNTSELTKAECYTIRQNLIMALQRTKRLIVIDVTDEGLVEDEAERRKNESAMGDTRQVADITTLQANYIITMYFKSISYSTKEVQVRNVNTGTTSTKTMHIAAISYAINLLNPATGATESVHEYESSAQEDTKALARTHAVDDATASLNRFIEECFPIKGEVIAVADTDKKGVKATSVYVNIGSNEGLTAGQKVMVFVEVDIAGELSQKHIGELTVTEVLGKNRSSCKVNQGGEEIVTAKSKNQKVFVQTRAKKAGVGSVLGNFIQIN